MHSWASQHKKSTGFTIVELLIVVVVIAILAAITIVAYNGIQNRAKASAAQSVTTQAYKKIALWQVDNPGQSPSLSQFTDIVGAANVSQYQYTQKTNGAFCVTGTSGNVSYYASNTQNTPVAGACAGHGAGGVATITNLVNNPSFASGANTTYASGSGGQVSNNTFPANSGPDNRTSYRRSYTATSTGFGLGGDIFTTSVASASQYDAFSGSAYVRSSKAQSVQLQLQFINSSAGSSGVANGASVTLTPNVWTRLTVSGTAPANTVSFRLDLDGGTGAVQWASGDTLDYTMLMVTSGSTNYQYADGASPGWDWTGTANNSTSVGPPL